MDRKKSTEMGARIPSCIPGMLEWNADQKVRRRGDELRDGYFVGDDTSALESVPRQCMEEGEAWER